MVSRIIKFYFFGDSIFFGQHVSPHLTWVVKISEFLAKAGEDLGIEVVIQNPSVSGNTTRLALERIEYDALSHRPDILSIQFGLNDCNIWKTSNGISRIPPMSFESNLHEIIQRAVLMGVKMIILFTNHPTTRDGVDMDGVDYSFEQNNRRYNEILRKVAQVHSNVTLVDIEQDMLCKSEGIEGCLNEYLLDDKLHLSSKGHEFYFQQTNSILLKILKTVVNQEIQ